MQGRIIETFPGRVQGRRGGALVRGDASGTCDSRGGLRSLEPRSVSIVRKHGCSVNQWPCQYRYNVLGPTVSIPIPVTALPQFGASPALCVRDGPRRPRLALQHKGFMRNESRSACEAGSSRGQIGCSSADQEGGAKEKACCRRQCKHGTTKETKGCCCHAYGDHRRVGGHK